MKPLKIFLIKGSIIIPVIFTLSFPCFSAQKQTGILNNEYIISLSIDRASPRIIYAASQNYVYKTNDNGNNWQEIYNINTVNKEINKIYSDLRSVNNIYVATKGGLYQSKDQGRSWQRIFIGSSDLENNCLSVAKSSKAMYLGTMQGLFISYDQGKKWHKSFEQFSDSVISSIIINPQEDAIVYLACEKGVFISEDNGKNWKRIYVAYSSEIPAEDYGDYDGEVSDRISNIQNMAISSEKPNKLYISTSRGVFFTDSKGGKWEKLTNFGLTSLYIKSIAISSGKEEVFIATDKGVFMLNENFWQQIDSDLTCGDYSDLIIDKNRLVWLAGKCGVLKIDAKDIGKSENARKANIKENNKININDLFTGEPDIKEIQKAAIEYSETGMDKIKNWRKQARLKAFVPTVSLGYDKNVYGSSSGAMAVGPRGWNVDFSWSIADFIWSSDQTSIDTRSRLTVQLRQDILDQVTRLYYERRRLKTELLLCQTNSEEEKLYKALQFQEITANLDGLTNGYFSKSIKQIE